MKDYPFAYLSSDVKWHLNEQQASALRCYLMGGGFLMIDDSWGDEEFANTVAQLRKVFPHRRLSELPQQHPLFHCVYDLPEAPQVFEILEALRSRDSETNEEDKANKNPSYHAITNAKDRMMVLLCHNTDLADGWEHIDDNAWYAKEFSEKRAYSMGINIVFHVLNVAK